MSSFRTHLKWAPRFPRFLRWGLRVGVLFAAALLLIGGYFWLTTDLPTPERLRADAEIGNTRILDRRGHILYEVPNSLSGRHRPVALDEIPLALQQATIAIEDNSFYTNPGVDPRGIIRALWINLRRGDIVAGGSTITQQLARGFLLDPDVAQQRTLERKIREAVLALKLTISYTKDEILALYLNQSYYGGLNYGVEAAAHAYFGKPARDLDLAESALLAGLPQAPSRYNPFDNPNAAFTRQAQVLDAMVRAGYLTPEQAQVAKDEPLQFYSDSGNMRAPHFVRYVLDQLDAELGSEVVVRGGLTVTTTLDVGLHEEAQEILRRQIDYLATPQNGGPNHRVRNGAVVVLDPRDGAILAMVGSPDFDDTTSQGQVNAALSRRQPGSAIKPLTYAAALERGWTPATTILDIPSAFRTREGPPYTPQNYDRAYHGPLALREALATSSNVAAVRTLDEIGIPALLEIAERMGVTTLGRDNGRYGLSLTLGGGEVTPLELTAAYGAFANGGQRVTPFAIIGVSDFQRLEIGDWRLSNEARNKQSPISNLQSLSPQVAYLISDILSDRYARMRAFGAQSVLDIDRPAAVKTGTTSDWRDNWTIGYTPDRVVGVWIGNADGQPMELISGVTGAGPVWHQVMLEAHRDLPPRPFAQPEGIVEIDICAEGGLLPGPACPATLRERFVEGAQPERPDDTHIAVPIDKQLGCRAPAGYPAERTILQTFRILPPEAQAWALDAGLPQPPREMCLPTEDGGRGTDDKNQGSGVRGQGLETVGRTTDDRRPTTDDRPLTTNNGQPTTDNGQLALTTPADGAVFALSPGVPPERRQMTLQARASAQTVELTFYIDGEPVATLNEAPYRALWRLAPGRHRAFVETKDEQGNVLRSDEITFEVVTK
jgi:1A family penicillin-binding protein